MEDDKISRLGYSSGERWCDLLDAIESYGPDFAAGFYAGRMDRLRLGLANLAAGAQDDECEQ